MIAGLFGVAAAALTGPALAQGQPRYSLTLYDRPDYRGASVTFYSDNANIGSTGFASRAQSAQVRGTWRLCEGGGFRNRCEVLSANVRDLAAHGFADRVGSAQLLAEAPAAAYDLPGPPQAYGQAPPVYSPQGADAAYPPPPYDNRDQVGRDRYAQDSAAADRDAPPASPPPYGRGYAQAPYPPAADAARPYGLPPAPYEAAPYGAAAGPGGAYPSDDDRGAEGRTAVFFDRPSVNGQDVSAWSPRAADAFCRTQGLGPALYSDRGRQSANAVDPDGRPAREGPVLSDVLCRK